MTTPLNPLLILLKQQAAQIDTLEGQVLDLKCALGFDKVANVQRAFGLTETLAQLLLLLEDGMPKNREQLHAGLYYDRPGDIPDLKLLDSTFHKLRKCIEHRGIEIATVRGRGYQLVAGVGVVHRAARVPWRPWETEGISRATWYRQRRRYLRKINALRASETARVSREAA